MPKGLRSIQISVGEASLTHFGGIVLIQRFCKKLRLTWHLQNQVRFSQRSSQYHPVELIIAIIFLPAEYIPKQSLETIIQKIEGMKPL